MAHVIVKIVAIDGAKSVKFEGDEATKIAESHRVKVDITPVANASIVVTVICED